MLDTISWIILGGDFWNELPQSDPKVATRDVIADVLHFSWQPVNIVWHRTTDSALNVNSIVSHCGKAKKVNQTRVISGCPREVDANCAFLGYYAASNGNFRGQTHEDGTDRLSQNFCNKLALLAA
jgi:hypothetical protein